MPWQRAELGLQGQWALRRGRRSPRRRRSCRSSDRRLRSRTAASGRWSAERRSTGSSLPPTIRSTVRGVTRRLHRPWAQLTSADGFPRDQSSSARVMTCISRIAHVSRKFSRKKYFGIGRTILRFHPSLAGQWRVVMRPSSGARPCADTGQGARGSRAIRVFIATQSARAAQRDGASHGYADQVGK
jgi:hypothetical protein